MTGQIQPTKTEKILLILTAMFLCLLLALLFHTQSAGAEGRYMVSTERTASSSELLPEEEPETGPVNINTAGREALATLPGIGEKLAERIVAYREEHGRFETVEELVNVSGIGEGKLSALREYVSVG